MSNTQATPFEVIEVEGADGILVELTCQPDEEQYLRFTAHEYSEYSGHYGRVPGASAITLLTANDARADQEAIAWHIRNTLAPMIQAGADLSDTVAKLAYLSAGDASRLRQRVVTFSVTVDVGVEGVEHADDDSLVEGQALEKLRNGDYAMTISKPTL